MNYAVDCTERILAGRLWQAAVPHYSVLVMYVWSILLGIVALALSRVTKDVGKLKPLGKLLRLGPGWCDLDGVISKGYQKGAGLV